jgi:hypothetical protein
MRHVNDEFVSVFHDLLVQGNKFHDARLFQLYFDQNSGQLYSSFVKHMEQVEELAVTPR